MRPSGRLPSELRSINIKTSVSRYAEGSCLIEYGNTHVLCTASLEERVPPFLKNTGKGWLSAEYSMLPRATHTRTRREASEGKLSGRTMEIQRLIGRSLRCAIDLDMLGERQITIDCDVLQADGGTRTAAITGGYVALHLACKQLIDRRILRTFPLLGPVAALSCGIYNGVAIADLDYDEDSNAEMDANFVMNQAGKFIEIQATAEQSPCSSSQMNELMQLAEKGINQLINLQKKAIEVANAA